MRIFTLCVRQPLWPTVGISEWLLHVRVCTWEEMRSRFRSVAYFPTLSLPNPRKVCKIVMFPWWKQRWMRVSPDVEPFNFALEASRNTLAIPRTITHDKQGCPRNRIRGYAIPAQWKRQYCTTVSSPRRRRNVYLSVNKTGRKRHIISVRFFSMCGSSSFLEIQTLRSRPDINPVYQLNGFLTAGSIEFGTKDRNAI